MAALVLDTSAIIALLTGEPDAPRIFTVLEQAEARGVGAPTLSETGLVLGTKLGFSQRLLHRFIQEFSVTVMPFSDPHWQTAVMAYERYGKGRHPAKLNFGDCLSYACAKLVKQPLLCKGNDFVQTDLELVRY